MVSRFLFSRMALSSARSAPETERVNLLRRQLDGSQSCSWRWRRVQLSRCWRVVVIGLMIAWLTTSELVAGESDKKMLAWIHPIYIKLLRIRFQVLLCFHNKKTSREIKVGDLPNNRESPR